MKGEPGKCGPVGIGWKHEYDEIKGRKLISSGIRAKYLRVSFLIAEIISDNLIAWRAKLFKFSK
jgi:hypothetical protein